MATFTSNGTPITEPSPQYDIPIISNNGVLKARHQSGLPLGYTLLDYIETDGKSWFATGINVDATTELEITASNITSASAQLMVARTISTGKYFRLAKASASQRLIGSVGNQTITDLNNDGANKFTAKVNISSFYVDGTLIGNFASATPDLSEMTEIDVFKGTYGNNTYYAGAGSRLYRAVIRKNNIAVIDLIPCKDASNVIGMYDLVSGQFFTNAGTGDFVAGNTVSDPVEIYTDGTAETINIHGKNLFDSTPYKTGYYIDASGNEVEASQYQEEYLIRQARVQPSTQYTISLKGVVGGYTQRIHAYDAAGNWLSQVAVISNVSVGVVSSESFTTPANCAYIRQGGRSQTEYQLERGSTATDYEPYYNGGTATAEMLLKVGDYQDVQSIIDGVVTRNVGIKVLDGTESNFEYVTGRFSFLLDDTFALPNTCICTHYIGVSSDTTVAQMTDMQIKCGYTGFQNKVYLKDSRFTSAATMQQWLADQYAAGTPVIVVYPLATPTTESVAGQTLQVTDGDNTLEITQASLNGLELEAQYQASVSLTIQEVQDANLDPNVEVTIN